MEPLIPSPSGGGSSAFLDDFDRHAALAVTYLAAHLMSESERLVALARERFVEGFELYPNGPLFSKSSWELVGEADEELADAIVYVARMLSL